MAPPVSDRFRLEMRLGRDQDIEEWLATDTSLERPVLIRSLGPESSQERRAQFIAAVSGAAKTAHSHLARVFAVEDVAGGAYAVCEWTGGASAADRIAAEQMVGLEEFLPNASGLAGALAALHESGAVHGRIDLSAISWSVAHPAKLGGFGREARTDQDGDVRALAAALETALTGSAPGGSPPSESIDGVPRAIDRILRSAQSGRTSAADLEKALIAAPSLRAAQPEPPSTSRRLLYVAIGLVVLAVGLVALGRLFIGGGEPIIPVIPPSTTLGPAPTSTVVTVTTLTPGPVRVVGFGAFDPFGDGTENDDAVGDLLDGSASTLWRSERYDDPLSLVKPGVGLRFQLTGTPTALQLVGLSSGTTFEILWAREPPQNIEGWEPALSGSAQSSETLFPLPPREGGHWLLWMTEFPQQPDGSYYAELAEVRFTP
jgi:hypothetical protein